MSRLIHPRMMDSLTRDFFPHVCRIDAKTVTQDASGHETPTWQAVSGWEEIACRKAPLSGNEQRTGNQTYLEATEKIILVGQYAGMNETMRAVVDGQAYDILVVEPDSEGVNTRLMVRLSR